LIRPFRSSLLPVVVPGGPGARFRWLVLGRFH